MTDPRPMFLPPDAHRRRNGDVPPAQPELHVHLVDETPVWPTALTLLLMALGAWKLIELVAHAV